MAQYASTTVPSYCSKGARPQLLTGALVQWLRAHYQDAANLEMVELGLPETEMIWSEGPATKLVIESITRYDPLLIEARPALIVKRNAMRFLRRGIDNRLIGRSNKDGSRDYAAFWQGSHTVFCLAGEGAEAELLGTETYRELGQFAPLMRKALGLHRLELIEVGDAGIIEEGSQRFVVPVSLAWCFEEAWKVRPEAAARLSRIKMAIM